MNRHRLQRVAEPPHDFREFPVYGFRCQRHGKHCQYASRFRFRQALPQVATRIAFARLPALTATAPWAESGNRGVVGSHRRLRLRRKIEQLHYPLLPLDVALETGRPGVEGVASRAGV